MAQRECIFVLKIILNGVAKAPPLKLSRSLWLRRTKGFLHSNQNDARALSTNAYKGLAMSRYKCIEYFLPDDSPVSTRNYFLAEKWGITANGWHICEGTAFGKRQPNICTEVDSSTNAQLLPSAVLLQICLLVAVFFMSNLE